MLTFRVRNHQLVTVTPSVPELEEMYARPTKPAVTANVERLWATYDYISEHQVEWRQNSWEACFGHHAGRMFKYADHPIPTRSHRWQKIVPATDPYKHECRSTTAFRVLNVSRAQGARLFCASNTMSDLRKIITQIENGELV